MSQPTVSRALARLRAYFDDPLFVLTGKRKLETLLAPSRILCHVPSYTSAAHIALHTDAIVTIALRLARDLGLVLARLPIDSPPVHVALYWHERSHRDPANVWLRAFVRTTLSAADWASADA